jgi:uncharacterized protein (TIGR03546 family)
MPRRFLRYLLQPLDLLGAVLTDAGSPRQVAWGFALGMLVGLVPKGNLTAAGLAVLLLATRANLAAAALATLVFSWLGMLADPLTHGVGLALLTSSTLRPFWDWFYGLPLGPWLGLHNTVVLGNLLCGLTLLLPVYAMGIRVAQRVLPWASELWFRWRMKSVVFALRVVDRRSTR